MKKRMRNDRYGWIGIVVIRACEDPVGERGNGDTCKTLTCGCLWCGVVGKQV